ncbi:hypothetical protein GQX74_001060 [Glossina fuscipes]|nr:hypothetical protein GQX74_001060 [Glossina fuscipes]
MSVEDHVKKVGDSNSNFEPLSPMKRRSSLKAAGVHKTIDCRKLRKSRCTCRGMFKPDAISRSQVEIGCRVRSCLCRSSET